MFWILQHPPQFQRLYRVSLQDSKHLRTFIVVCKTAVCHGCSCDEDSCATAVWKGSCFWGGQWCRHLTRYQPHTTGKGNTKSQQSSMGPWVFFVLFVWKNGNVWGCKYENYVRTGRYPKHKNVFWQGFLSKTARLLILSSRFDFLLLFLLFFWESMGSHKIQQKTVPQAFFLPKKRCRRRRRFASSRDNCSINGRPTGRSYALDSFSMTTCWWTTTRRWFMQVGERMYIFVCKNTWCGTWGGKWRGGEDVNKKPWECNKNGWSKTRDDRIVRTFWTCQWI